MGAGTNSGATLRKTTANAEAKMLLFPSQFRELYAIIKCLRHAIVYVT